MGNEKSLSLIVSPQESGERIDKFLGRIADIGSRSRALELIEQGRVLIRGKVVKASYSLHPNDNIQVEIPGGPSEAVLEPLKLKLDVVFEDKDLLVINKPAGLVVHPAAGHSQDTLVNALLHHTKDLAIGFGELRPGIVHRLDRDTSGLLVVAKTDFAHKDLAEQFKQKTTHRIYRALIYGVPKSRTGRIETRLARHPRDRKRFASTKGEGKLAITHYEVLRVADNNEISLIELRLETGRTHQIRVHLSELGHPIVGDSTYGADSRTKKMKSVSLRKEIDLLPRFILHAFELGFTHPRTGERLLFKSEWPSEIEPFIRKLKL